MQTFAQYLITQILPSDIPVTKQIDKSELGRILTTVATRYPDRYDKVITDLKRLADHMSTMEALTIGLDEIDVPNRAKRDAIIKKYEIRLEKDKKTGDQDKILAGLGQLQKELAENDLAGTKDDASTMVKSSLTGKKVQLMKMRTSPGVVAGTDGSIVPIIFPKSYSQGVDPLHFWLGAAESRINIAQGAVNTAKPGEFNKIFANVMNTEVVSTEDCGTSSGIMLETRDDSIIDRYLARDTGRYKRNDLITPDMQQELLKAKILNILVRSPQTCAAKDGSVCQKCMGLRPGTGKNYEIGDNAGVISAGSMGEPLQQMVLSAKHSAAMAEVSHDLKGESGFRQFVEIPTNYPNRKVLCEVIGVIARIHTAPQGGRIVTIRQTRPVPERYIVRGMKNEKMKGYWDYFIPPQLKLAEGIEINKEVWPGMELSNGVDNMKDVARLRNLGFARSVASQNMYNIYKNTGMKLDRRHFELLSRATHGYVRIDKAPRALGILPGETVKYQELVNKIANIPHKTVPIRDALGKVLAEGVVDLTVGTELDTQAIKRLEADDIKEVVICDGLEIEAVTTPLTRVVNQSPDWLASMNHRYLKAGIKDAAGTGKKSDIHSFNPVTAYAYGAEFGKGKDGRY